MNSLKTPRLSIVMPVYNRKYVISRALESILQQTFKDFEIIIVDDASTDNLEDALNLYSDPRLRSLKHHENKGAAAARNTGIKAACGDLIAFLDSDDAWCVTKLEKQIAHFDKLRKKNKNIMGSFTFFFLHRQNGSLEERQFKPAKDWRKFFLAGCFISPGSTLLVDRKVFDIIGFYDESLQRLEDWDWLLRFSRKFDFAVCEILLSHIHKGQKPPYQSVSSSVQKITQKHLKALSASEKLKFLSTCSIELCYSCIRENFLKACLYLLFAVILNPFLFKKVFYVFIREVRRFTLNTISFTEKKSKHFIHRFL